MPRKPPEAPYSVAQRLIRDARKTKSKPAALAKLREAERVIARVVVQRRPSISEAVTYRSAAPAASSSARMLYAEVDAAERAITSGNPGSNPGNPGPKGSKMGNGNGQFESAYNKARRLIGEAKAAPTKAAGMKLLRDAERVIPSLSGSKAQRLYVQVANVERELGTRKNGNPGNPGALKRGDYAKPRSGPRKGVAMRVRKVGGGRAKDLVTLVMPGSGDVVFGADFLTKTTKPANPGRKKGNGNAKPKKVDVTANFQRVRMKEPRYVEYRNPEWAARVARSVAGAGAEVTMGLTAKGAWKVQSVQIPKKRGRGDADAKRLAKQITDKIEGG